MISESRDWAHVGLCTGHGDCLRLSLSSAPILLCACALSLKKIKYNNTKNKNEHLIQDPKQTSFRITLEKWTECNRQPNIVAKFYTQFFSEGKSPAKIYPIKGSRQWKIFVWEHDTCLFGAGVQTNSREITEHLIWYGSWQSNSINICWMNMWKWVLLGKKHEK